MHENPLPGRNPTKVRTHRYPNIQLKSIFSPSLGGTVRTHVTTGVLEEIDRLGGLDNYVFQAKPEDLGVWGLRIKYEMIQVRLECKAMKLIAQAQLRRAMGTFTSRPPPRRQQAVSVSPAPPAIPAPPAPLLESADRRRLQEDRMFVEASVGRSRA